jgi:predicted lipoprotein with Yx(FWY)xxD motif
MTGEAYEVKSVQDATLGAYLAGEDGRTLYVFLKDTGGTSACTGACATTWPPFTIATDDTLTPGDGVTGKFATIKRDDGSLQVTYEGAPLYYFAKDTKAGDVNGQGVGGVWFVAAVAGGPGGASASPSPAASAATSGTTASIVDFAFQPATLTVPVGTTITWTNTGATAHTVTADDGSFDSASVAPGQTFSHAFTTAGTFTYHCAIHPSMTATVTVQ